MRGTGWHAWRNVRLAVVALSLLAVGCGGNDSDSQSDDAAGVPPAVNDVDPNGVLRIGTQLTSGTANVQFDLPKAVSPAPPLTLLVYDTLLRARPGGTYESGLAKSATVVDPQTIKVELNPGIKFSDGTPLDAEAAKFSIERNAAA